jgi:GH25 family lysozyme M1 (1,4-beta-N-acetylmuramidase)
MQQRRSRPIRKYAEVDDTVVAEKAGEIAAQEATSAVSGIDLSTYQEIIDIVDRLDALEQP